jgi:hypothetical protein
MSIKKNIDIIIILSVYIIIIIAAYLYSDILLNNSEDQIDYLQNNISNFNIELL